MTSPKINRNCPVKGGSWNTRKEIQAKKSAEPQNGSVFFVTGLLSYLSLFFQGGIPGSNKIIKGSGYAVIPIDIIRGFPYNGLIKEDL